MKNKDFSRRLIESSYDDKMLSSSKNQVKENEKENYVSQPKPRNRNNISHKEDYAMINDITEYATKSRRNLVDNNSRIVQSNSTFLQEMNTEDDLLCNTEAIEEAHPKSAKDNSIIEAATSSNAKTNQPSHPQKSIQ